jgi:hypothetical protein
VGSRRRDAAHPLQGSFEPTQKGPVVIMVGIVVEDLIEDALVTAIIHRTEDTEWVIIEFVGRYIPGAGNLVSL